MSVTLEGRFERYCQSIVAALGHADRRQPAQWYLKGLILPGQRKSVEPMAARAHPEDVRSAHQSMHHLVAMADWEDRAVLGTVAQQVTPQLVRGDEDCWWILDDTGHAKKGTKSVGVARQYCGRLGKTDNCQIAVSLSLASARGSIPLAYRLYLPQEWTEDRVRCRAAALAQGVPRGIVLGGCRLWRRYGFPGLADRANVGLRAGCEVGNHCLVGQVPAGESATTFKSRPAAHAPGSRYPPSTDPRGAARPGLAAEELATDQLARRNQRHLVLALCTRTRASGSWQPGTRRGVAADRMAGGRTRAHSLLVIHPAQEARPQEAGAPCQGALEDRARLSGAQIGTRPESLRGA